jgi:hypothetical protein
MFSEKVISLKYLLMQREDPPLMPSIAFLTLSPFTSLYSLQPLQYMPAYKQGSSIS